MYNETLPRGMGRFKNSFFGGVIAQAVLDLEKIQHVVCADFDGKKTDLPEVGFLGK